MQPPQAMHVVRVRAFSAEEGVRDGVVDRISIRRLENAYLGA